MGNNAERLSTMNVSLPEELRRSAEQLAAARHFASLSEYIRHLIRDDLIASKQAAAESALAMSLGGKKTDRKLVMKAVQELTQLRKSVQARGKALTLEELRAAIDEGLGA